MNYKQGPSFFLLYVVTIIITCQFVSCLKSNDIRHHLGTRTPYRFKCNKNDTRIKYPNCRDSKIWMIVRHGTRLPGLKDIKAVQNLTALKFAIASANKAGRGSLTKDQVKNILEWSPEIDIEEPNFLTQEGEDEMRLIAKRMQKRFPNAIKRKYNNNTFLFRYTPTQRTQHSARHFTSGLFDKKDSQDVMLDPATKADVVLRFYKYCNRWQKQVKKNPETYKQLHLYGVSKEMNDTLETVSLRLGLSKVLTLDTVLLMYKYCGYETAWTKYHTSPWCNAFDENTIQVLEYYDDLKTYWVDGYGHTLTYRPACLSINNMLDNFRNASGPQATFLFTHSGTILKLLAYLGMYKPDSHLTGEAMKKDRPWKSSEIDCFASNLAFVFFNCKDGDYVLTLHQEKIVRMPMCDQELCPLQRLLDHFHDFIQDCDYSNMCDLEPMHKKKPVNEDL